MPRFSLNKKFKSSFNKKSLKFSGWSDLLLVQLQWSLQLRDWSELQSEPGQPIRDPFSNLKRLSNKIVDVKQVRYSFRKSYEGPLNNVKWSKRPLYWNPLLKIHHKLPNVDDKLFQKRVFIEKYFVIHRNIFTKDLQQYSLGPILIQSWQQKIQIYLFFRLWISFLLYFNIKP